MATAANGVSSPIEKVGSLASVAIGLSTMATSSLLTPKATWVRMMSASSASSDSGVPIGNRRSPSYVQREYGARPASVRLMAASVRNPLLPVEDGVGIDAEHLAGPEPAAPHLAVAGDRHRPDLGGADDEPVVADLVAQRPQPVAVERRTGPAAVGEDEPGGPVPRLGQAGVVPEEVPDVGRRSRLPSQASGTSMATAWRMSRPPETSSSTAVSSLPESESSGSSSGEKSSSGPRPASSVPRRPRAAMRCSLPRKVLISPLWHRYRNGWARSQAGVVLVENREWNTTSGASKSEAARSG